jgi:hypothetical protein
MGSKKRVVLDLNAKVKVIEASEKDKLTVTQTVGKTQVYNISKSKSDIKRKWLTGNGSMKRKLKKTGYEDITKLCGIGLLVLGQKNLAYLDQCCNRKQKKWLIN